jgi:lycopene cyclase domain-containing protein
MGNWTYAFLLTASFIIPFTRSFENRVAFYRKFPELFSGIIVMMLLFIPWDIAFTRMGVWSFNNQYITGVYLLNLPLEEWMFFIIITYCCVFIYEVLKYFFPGFCFPGPAFTLTVLLGIFTLITALVNTDKIYTLSVMSLSCILLSWQLVTGSYKTWLSHFYFMFFISLLPFFIVNGILTALPVVNYDNSENMAVRIGSIPFEDTFYFLSMMLLTLMVYEYRARKRYTGKTRLVR